jgi:SAM-dependent methyltransferase
VNNSSEDNQQRLYKDLSWLWPIVSPPEDYIDETDYYSAVINKHAGFEVKSVLNLGCGGGHHDYTLKKHFNVTGIDTGESMLKLARNLNPEVSYIEGDMRNLQIDGVFDAVTIFDSINSMLTENDLAAVFTTAYIYLKPDGVMLTMTEMTKENFHQNRMSCSTHVKDDIEITFIENYFDSNPGDTICEMTLVFLIRQGGRLKIENDRHLVGIFRKRTWLDTLVKAGFNVLEEQFKPVSSEEDSFPLFICTKPLV